VVLEHGDHLVDDFDRGMAPALAFPDLVRVATTLDNYSTPTVSLSDRDEECAKPRSRA
jgi:hypothetical protein